MSSEFSRIKKDIIASTIRAESAVVGSVSAETVSISQVVNGNSFNSPIGDATALGASGSPASVAIFPAALAAGYDIVGTYTSATPADDRFVTFTLNDPTLAVGDEVVVTSATPAISAPTAAVVVSVAGTVDVAVEFTTVDAAGSYRVDLAINKVGA